MARSSSVCPGATWGCLTAVFTGSQAVANPLWGLLGDRAGHKIVLVGAAVLHDAGCAGALLTPWPIGMYVVFALTAQRNAADSVSAQNVVMEFAAPDERPTYVGLSNTLQGSGARPGPDHRGLLATVLGYRGMFPVAIVLAAVGGVMLALWFGTRATCRKSTRSRACRHASSPQADGRPANGAVSAVGAVNIARIIVAVFEVCAPVLC